MRECQQRERKVELKQTEERNERATEKANKEHLEGMCDEITEFQRREHCCSMYMTIEELGWRDNQGVHTSGIEDGQENVIVDQIQVLKICEKSITELHDLTSRPENLEVVTEE
jgi:hypothetical protein